jgi:hypothetical protein
MIIRSMNGQLLSENRSMGNWRKIGKIYETQGQYEWMKSHATVPIPYHLGDDIYRFYFSTRDSINRNQLGSIEIDLSNPAEYYNLSSLPHFCFGEEGYFDCDGIYGTALVKHNDELWLYYAGWNAGLRGLFYSAIGLAFSKDNGLSFQRVKKSPILARDEIDPWAVMAPFVMKESSRWIMWYTSGIKIKTTGGKITSLYDVKTAISKNGIDWVKTGKSAIELTENDSNIARACVIKEKGLYRVWYPVVSKKSQQYRIGYGESDNGLLFERKEHLPEAGLDSSNKAHDWDSNAVTYPYVFNHKGTYYMLYNGNNFGKTGFGLAVWSK